MATEKAYKLVAAQEGISNTAGKSMIDRGLVYVGNKKVMIARGELNTDTKFRLIKLEKAVILFENDDIVVVDKPTYVNSDEIEREFKPAVLLHRLDRETSGVLMLVKNEEFREKAIKEFRQDKVYKEYIAWVEGTMSEPIEVDKAITTQKKNNKAYSNVSPKGKPARSEFTPDIVSANKTKIKCIIHHGRTHQIRVHLRYINHSIIGDEQYGGRRAKRVMLHAHKVRLLGMEFISPEPKAFKTFE